MPICSYLVVPESGAKDRVSRRLAALDGCEVVEAENRDLLILLTETPDLMAEESLRSDVEDLEGIEALLFTFGEIDPDTDLADPVAVGGRRNRRRAGDFGDRGALDRGTA